MSQEFRDMSHEARDMKSAVAFNEMNPVKGFAVQFEMQVKLFVCTMAKDKLAVRGKGL